MEESNCYLKIHSQANQKVIGACDEDCLGLVLQKGKFRYEVRESFFKGRLVPLSEVIPILENSTNFNAVGEKLISALIKAKIIHEDGVSHIQGIPIALRFIF